jgi:7-cyano-7-deazaguanine tRNA-ribosyltransferase
LGEIKVVIGLFEIKYRDAGGRIGTFDVKGKKVATPMLLPVINPRTQDIPAREIKKMGFEGVITNSYLIYKDPALKERALKEGVHGLLDYDGMIMTDSGSFQLYKYGKVQITPEEIVRFQDDIGVDIGVILDIPTPPDVPEEKARSDLLETLKRARESIGIPRDFLLSGTIQGSTHMDLREESAREMAKLDFDLYPIGGVVPLMEAYRYSDLVDVIIHSKHHLPPQKPVHLFGCGHPMVFALGAALGCDIFDSAAYAIYARDGRYITPDGTLKLENMVEFPCQCPVCSDNSPREVMGLQEEEKHGLLSRHNLHISLEEIKRVRQAIYEGSLWELLQTRCRSHPYLLEALKRALGHEYVEPLDPVAKRTAFFYGGPESLMRPEVKRHIARLENIRERGKTLLVLPETEKPFSRHYQVKSNRDYHVCVLSGVFGIVPLEIEEIYPLTQHEAPRTPDLEQMELMKRVAGKYSEGFDRVFYHPDLPVKLGGETINDLSIIGRGDDILKVRAMADYLFGNGAGRIMFPDDARVEWSRTGRIRRIYDADDLLATARASDGHLILTPEGGSRLLGLKAPQNRVVVEDEVSEFIKDGKSVFAKFVTGADPAIRPYQEVLVVDGNDHLLATGTAILTGTEMMSFTRGMAVRTRHRVP